MPNKELQSALARIGNTRAPESESRIFKIFELLNRPHSAISGAISEAAEGGDPFAAVGNALSGRETFSGRDVVSSVFNVEDDSKVARRAGLAFDILNPIDPLNFVGVGGLTKAGKAAKLAKGLTGGKNAAADLAKGFGAQSRAGQRGLVTFAGQRVPLPGDALILDSLQKTGGVLKQSKAGKGVRQLFGGRKGFLETKLNVKGDEFQQFIDAQDIAERTSNIFGAETSRFINTIKSNVKRDERDSFLEFLDQTGKAEGNLATDATRFIGAGKGSDRRRKAVEAANDLFERFDRAGKETLGGTGIGRFTEDKAGFVSRITKFNGEPDEATRKFFGPSGAKTGEVLTGRVDNSFTRGLVSDLEQPVSIEMLTDAGKNEARQEAISHLGRKGVTVKFDTNIDEAVRGAFEEMRDKDPQKFVDFLKRNRLPLKEMDARLKDAEIGSLVKNPALILKHMQEQIQEQVKTSTLIESLQKAGITRKWADLAEDEKGLFTLVNIGKWETNPIAIPNIYDDALERYREIFMPGGDKPMFGQFLNSILPEQLQNLGLLSWWKGFAITGGGPTSFWTRNFATGVIKNYYEGLGPMSPQGLQQAGRFYTEGFKILGQTLKGRLDESGEALRGVFKTSQGVEVDYIRIMQEYMARRFHGGGSPTPEIVQGIENASTAAREAVFGGFHRGNFRVEMGIRIPLMLKTLEDTFEAAQKRGIALPTRIGALSETPEALGDVFDVAMTNAKEAVLRAHFDYDDLTPFERQLRGSWIPFYTWMRKNIPNETVNMVQNSGKYMPFARAYYNAFEQQGITPEDLPEWAQKSFATPISPDSEEERVRWLDFTGFLPFLDVTELADAAVGTPTPGRTRKSEALRYVATRFNPFITQTGEQLFQRNAFTRRAFSGDTPKSIFGQTVSGDVENLLNIFRPFKEIDRLNPGDIFGDTPRPGRNEPGQIQRLLRTGTGLKIRATDRDEASLSQRSRERRIETFKRNELRALREGDRDKAEFFKDRRESLERGVR